MRIGGSFRITALAVVVLTVAGCGGEPAGGEAASTTPAGSSVPATSTTVPKTPVPPPKAYTTAKGWETEVRGEWYALPRTKAVAFFEGVNTERGKFTVLDVATGRTLWSSEELTAGPHRGYRAMSARVAGEDYLVAWTSGKTGEDSLNKGRVVTSMAIFAGSNTGDRVKPSHHVDIEGEGTVNYVGGGLAIESDKGHVVVDLESGTTKAYGSDVQPPANCHECGESNRLAAMTPNGPLFSGREGFWVAGGWSSEDLGITEPRVHQPRENTLLVEWSPPGSDKHTWTVLDTSTGKSLATTQCSPFPVLPRDEEDIRLSANGRYLIDGRTAFDLEKGTGYCSEDTDSTKALTLRAVTDTGMAYGTSDPDWDGEVITAEVDIATGQAKATEESLVPVADLGGYGVFELDAGRDLVFYPHA